VVYCISPCREMGWGLADGGAARLGLIKPTELAESRKPLKIKEI